METDIKESLQLQDHTEELCFHCTKNNNCTQFRVKETELNRSL